MGAGGAKENEKRRKRLFKVGGPNAITKGGCTVTDAGLTAEKHKALNRREHGRPVCQI